MSATKFDRGLGAALVFMAVLTFSVGCSSIPSELTSCEQSFDQMVPIPPADDGIFSLVSDDLAQTLNSCGSVQEWTDGLRAHPDKVAKDEISNDDALAYLGGACNLLPDTGAGNAVCDEAYDEGLLGLP